MEHGREVADETTPSRVTSRQRQRRSHSEQPNTPRASREGQVVRPLEPYQITRRRPSQRPPPVPCRWRLHDDEPGADSRTVHGLALGWPANNRPLHIDDRHRQDTRIPRGASEEGAGQGARRSDIARVRATTLPTSAGLMMRADASTTDRPHLPRLSHVEPSTQLTTPSHTAMPY